MPRVGFEPTISAGERPQTHASDRSATGVGRNSDASILRSVKRKFYLFIYFVCLSNTQVIVVNIYFMCPSSTQQSKKYR